MFDYDKWTEIFNSIMRHKLRTALTALGVFWGIFMLVLLLGAGQGLENGVNYEFRDDAINSVFVRRGFTSMPYNGLPEGRRIQFDNQDYDYLIEQFEDIEYMTGRFYLSGDQTVRYKNRSLSYSTRGVHPDHQYLENSQVADGRYINDLDLKELRKVCVIGQVIKKEIFGSEPAVGQELQIGNAVYTIVGVYTDTGGDNEMRIIYTPISTVQAINNNSRNLHQLMFTTGDLSVPEVNALEDEVRLVLSQRHEFDVRDRRAVWMFNLSEEYAEISNLLWAIKAFVWFVGIGSIIAGIIGVSNIMLIVVKDRTKEIGIRKALGATPRSIISMILQESIFVTALAGYGGLVLGVVILSLIGSVEVDFFRNPQIDIKIGVIATVVLVLAGTLAGLMPARQAASINPVEAMRA
jgi:putative ABC transport system permease protein